MCSGFEAGSYLRLIDFVYDSTLGLRVIKKKQHAFGIGIPWRSTAGFASSGKTGLKYLSPKRKTGLKCLTTGLKPLEQAQDRS